MKFDVQELNAAGPGTQGNATVVVDREGRLHVVWEESLTDDPAALHTANTLESKPRDAVGHRHGRPTGSGRVIMYACSRRADGQFTHPFAIRPQPGRFQMRPTIACGADGLIVAAWMELDEAGKRAVVSSVQEIEQVTVR
jgi:hypothetical protein